MAKGMKGASRLLWVDYARGLAILMVVYRHAVVGLTRSGIPVTPLMYNLQEVVFNFRMPVFFVLSGVFLAASLRKRAVSVVVGDKVSTLLYPYFLWSCVTLLLQLMFDSFSNSKVEPADFANILLQPRAIAHFWYLLALFNTSMLFLIFSKITTNKWIHLLVALCLHFLSTLPVLQPLSIVTDLFYFYPFLVLGFYLSDALLGKDPAFNPVNPRQLVWVLPVCLAGQWVWFTNPDLGPGFLFMYFIIILIGCYCFYLLSDVLARAGVAKWLLYLGKNSLYIYILHVYLISMSRAALRYAGFHGSPWIILLVSWLCGVLIPILLYNGLRKIGFRKLFTLKPQAAA